VKLSHARQSVGSAAAAALLFSALAAAGCSSGHQPIAVELRDARTRDPVILIPGITGSQLRLRDSGELIWGSGKLLIKPRDGGYGAALSVDDPLRDALRAEAFAPVLELRLLGIVRKPVYGPLVQLMHDNGYRLGDLDAPRGGDSFFVFDYDWRLGAEHASRRLALQLEALARARGDAPTRVTLICQSNAALIARFVARYGAASLTEAEAGAGSPPSGVSIEKLILIGTSNGGSLRLLHEMNRGRRYVPLIGRKILPETLFAFPAMFDNLPAYDPRPFFDERGETLDVDLFDAANWERYGWSIYSPSARRRLARADLPDKFGDEASRRAYLARRLGEASLLHRLLQADPAGFEPPRIYMIQNAYYPTPDRALLLRDEDGFRTLFHNDRRVRRDPHLRSLAEAPGDGHATLRSQRWMSARELASLARPVTYIEDSHFELILDATTRRHVLEFLVD